MVSFATTRGFGGRNGLEPVSAWFQVAKWQALAVKQVAAETGIASVWSWGWGRWSAGEQDPEKGHAACVWLWARAQSLCDAPKQLGPQFDTSLQDGQLSVLRAAAQCLIGTRVLSNAAIRPAAGADGRPRHGVQRALRAPRRERARHRCRPRGCSKAEQAVIAQSFGGSRAAYVARAARRACVGGGRARRARRRASAGAGAVDAAGRLADRGADPDVLRVVPGALGAPRPVEARSPPGSARRRRASRSPRSRRRASSI